MNPEPPSSLSHASKIPLLSLTPLYCIITDADEVPLTQESKIVRYSEERVSFLGEEDRFLRHLRLYPPQCLLWNESTLPLESFASLGKEFSKLAEESAHIQNADILRGKIAHTPSIYPYMNVLLTEIRALQLYRRGRLVVGDSLVIFPEPFNVRMMARFTDMNVDYQAVEQYGPHYEFNCAEMRDFLIFYIRFIELTQVTDKYPEVQLAITRYCKETSQHGDVVDLMIALESLLVPEEEGIAFKLSQRVANLLGVDAASRKDLFRKIREFYALRSKTVHGAKLRHKETTAEQQLDELREITRKVILSVISLAAELGMGPDFPLLLNEMCLDDDLRRVTQEKASALMR
jgi:hypothetical protein